ncbi:MAG: deoxyribose-phosphate aldolase [Bacteroidales bacterium]|nr:deoxyribose-phosphate aldolase [Bacteroidales bacterium]
METLKLCLSLMDLTSLKSQDTLSSIQAFVSKVNDFPQAFPGHPLPAGICVYPNFVATVKKRLQVPGVRVVAVSGAFPASQSFLEVKLLETRLAVADGADEIDIVLALNAFLNGNAAAAAAEIRAQKELVGDRTLKVILETGVLKDPKRIYDASMLAMEAGADFIKTSTGKMEIGATPEAAEAMCRAIRDYARQTGRKVGFKAAGGISTTQQALIYVDIVRDTLGPQWLNPALMRLGVSRLGNQLLSSLSGQAVSYF